MQVPEPQQTSQDSYMEVTTRDIVGHQMKNLIDQREVRPPRPPPLC